MKASTTLAGLKKIDWSHAEASLWALFFEGKGENAPFTVRPVRTTEKLQRKLRDILVGQVKRAKSVQPYAYETKDIDEEEALVITGGRDLLHDAAGHTEAGRRAAITGDGSPIGSIEEVLSAAGYLIRLDAPNHVLHGFKKMPESITTKRKLFEVVFDKMELDEESRPERFRLSSVVDAFHFESTSFILSKRDFETGLRYREAMRTSAKAVLEDIAKAKVLANARDLLKGREDHYHVLRRLAGIGKDPRFGDPRWLTKVRELNGKHGWGLKFSDGGLILLDEECLNLVLTLLRDRRALTLIFNEMIDADVARVVASVNGDS